MIKVQKIKPYAVHKSYSDFGSGQFSSNVNSAKNYFHTKYNSWSLRNDRDYLYLYHIEKVNTKKENTKKKQLSMHGLMVVRRKVVTQGHTVLRVFRFKKDNVKSHKQHSRHFEVELKF
jgi:hypothetical protein